MELGHYMLECPEVERYMQDGKIRKNADGRLVLSTVVQGHVFLG